MKVAVRFKTDKKLKAAAQRLAKSWGISLAAIMNQRMRDLVAREMLAAIRSEKSKQ